MTPAQLDDSISTPNEAVIESLRGCHGNFAVLGAGGKMGFHFCLMLQKSMQALGRKEPVRAVSRFGSVRAREDFESIGCEVIAADLSDPEQLKNLPDTEHIFYLAGIKFGTAHDPGLLQKMNVEMPQLVANRFKKSSIVAMSTGCVYSFTAPGSGGSTEMADTDPPGDYANSCLGREKAFERNQSALIRLNYAIDLRYGVLVDIAQKVQTGEPVDISTNFVNLIWQGDAIRHTAQSLAYVATPPFILNVTGPEIHRVDELALEFGRRFNKEVRFTGEPNPVAWLNNASKSHQLFGKPEVTTDQMIDMVANWLKDGGELLGKPTGFQIRDGKY